MAQDLYIGGQRKMAPDLYMHSWDAANLEPSKTFSMRYKISNKFCNSENLFEMITF